ESVGARLLRGDENAWKTVLTEILPKARAAIQHKFGHDKLYYSAEDAVDSAVRITLRQLKENLLANGLNSWDDLLSRLLVVASNKIKDILRNNEAARRWKAKEQAKQADAENEKGVTTAFPA